MADIYILKRPFCIILCTREQSWEVGTRAPFPWKISRKQVRSLVYEVTGTLQIGKILFVVVEITFVSRVTLGSLFGERAMRRKG